MADASIAEATRHRPDTDLATRFAHCGADVRPAARPGAVRLPSPCVADASVVPCVAPGCRPPG